MIAEYPLSNGGLWWRLFWRAGMAWRMAACRNSIVAPVDAIINAAGGLWAWPGGIDFGWLFSVVAT